MDEQTKKDVASKNLGSKALEVSQVEPDDSSPAGGHNARSLKASLPPKRTILLGVIGGVFSSLTIILVAMFFLLAAHGSLARIYVGSLPIKSTSSQQVLEKQITQATGGYKVALKYQDGSKKYYPISDTGISIDASSSAQNLKKIIDHSYAQRLEWWRPIRLQLLTNANQAALSNFIATQATQADVAAKDASLSTANGIVTIVPGVPGKGSTVNNAAEVIPSAIANLSSAPLVLKDTVLEPSISPQDLQASQNKLKSLMDQRVVFNLAGKPITATPADIAGWMDLSPVESAKTVDINVDSGKIVQYINNIAGPYIQPPRSRLITTTATGSIVLDPGTNGIDVVNKNQTAATVAKQVMAGKGVTTDLSIQYATAQTVNVQPYSKWIVVDVTTKRMYAYEQTNLVRTFLISAGAPRTPTVLGQFAIYSKFVSQNMTGSNADGSRYFQPNVPYVNYFYSDYAIHGNYWRPASYFGNINSSHGCVGVEDSDAVWIYSWAPIGTPVIVHD